MSTESLLRSNGITPQTLVQTEERGGVQVWLNHRLGVAAYFIKPGSPGGVVWGSGALSGAHRVLGAAETQQDAMAAIRARYLRALAEKYRLV